ncbi:MAG: T9SS type A sorting domain-containing protein [Ignavibacteria bacterium]|nr:T9SS type A sorting domain-containing protein [Ignavibacteria bacterium]
MKDEFNLRKTATVVMILFTLSFLQSASAQINIGGEPVSSITQLNETFETVTLPEFDVQKMLEEDRITEQAMDMPTRYARVFDTDFTFGNSGSWEEMSDGSRIWRLAINSNGAVSLGLTYKEFFMPKGATLFVYNQDKSMVFGAFSELNNSADGIFATVPVYGSKVIIEYYEPAYSIGQGRFTISQVIHAYKDIFGFNTVLEEPCNININCPIGAPWQEQKRSVTRITFNQGTSGFLCSGSLINNTLNNRVPLYLYAEHCATDNYSTMVFYFNYENPTCIGTFGSLSNTMVGASLKAELFATDMRLIQLNQSVPAAYNAHFGGWDRSGATPQNQTAIHHPDGTVKKISIDNNPAASVDGFGGRLPNGFWQVIWDEGMTEGGSSGCPLFDQNKRIVGQNLGGNPANCNNPQSVRKVFGKLSESWAYGGSPASQLKDWLDPNNSGVQTLDGIDDITGVAPLANFTSSTQLLPLGGGTVSFYDLTTNGPTSWSWSFPGATPSTSSERNPTNISFTQTGNYTVSLTATNSFGSNLKTFVAYIKVQGVNMTPVSLQSPIANSRILVDRNDPSLVNFRWSSASPSQTVNYKFKIRRVGTINDLLFTSNNNGLDSGISFRESFLDSLITTLGSTSDSVLCAWRASGLNGADSVTANPFIVTIRRNPVGINQISSTVPEDFSLYANYPNPFNPKTIIKFDIARSSLVTLKIYNLLGEEVKTLVDRNLNAGTYTTDFDASSLSSGVYFYRLETEGFTNTRRMMLVK